MTPTSGPRTLVIHPGALGDVLQAVPALRALQALGHRVTFAGQPRLGRFLAGAGVLQAAVGFDGLGLAALFAPDPAGPEVRSRLGGFDRVVSWFGAGAEGYPERLRAIVPDALVARAVPEATSPATVWQHLLASVAPWGVNASRAQAPLTLPQAWLAAARRSLADLGAEGGRSLLVVHPGAGGPAKRWPGPSFARVIHRVVRERGCQVLVHRGPADAAAVEDLLGRLAVPVLGLHEPGLDLLAAVLGEAGSYLGADSGVSHLAAAVGASAVILFPPATHGRWAPWSPTAAALGMAGAEGEPDRVAEAVSERLRPSRRPQAGPPLGP